MSDIHLWYTDYIKLKCMRVRLLNITTDNREIVHYCNFILKSILNNLFIVFTIKYTFMFNKQNSYLQVFVLNFKAIKHV